MPPVNPADSPPQAGSLDADRLLDLFETGWQSGNPPAIDDFMRRFGGQTADPPRRKLLADLATIDLEYRWRRKPAGAKPWLLEDYLARYPELGGPEEFFCRLVGAEYRVRQRWGDRPGHAEYAARFPRHAAALRSVLVRIDTELALEQKSQAPDTPPPVATVTELMNGLRQCGFLGPSQFSELARAGFADPRTLAGELLRRNWLTPYQVNQLLQGHGADLVIGPYVLLEPLGEGGAGQVFQARHRKMDRVVALKLLRKELVADAEALGRFYREIQVVSQLDHPNVVHAFDAGPAGASHFLAMEYVQGTDLGKLVKQVGPLPVMQACEYIRQAACGLAHAHERGLVHRDIKPHNLIMSLSEGLVKLADLGLARLSRPANEEATAVLTGGVKGTGTLTPENAVLIGTLDYLSPEQALDFHAADIRSDIYSLGCTFYYLLTGRSPFAGTLAEKLMKHQQAEPVSVEQFRQDVPAGVLAVLRKMLAKRPKDRYQTPAEVADALASHCQGPGPVPFAGRRRVLATRLRSFGRLVLNHRWLASGTVGALLALLLLVMGLNLFKWPGQSPAPVPKSPAASALWQLQEALQKPAPDWKKITQQILQLRMNFPGTPESCQAAELMMTTVPSPLDQLDPKKIPAELRSDKQPKEVVAVLGQPAKTTTAVIAFSPDGRILASAGEETPIHLWDCSSGKEIGTLPESGHPVRCLTFSPDGERLAWFAGQGIKLWDVSTRKEQTFPGSPLKGVMCLAFSPDGRTLAAALRWGSVRLLDPNGQRSPAILEKQGNLTFAMAFAPDGRSLAVASFQCPIKRWELSSGRELPGCDVPGARWLAYLPDGKSLLVGINQYPMKHSVRVLDLHTMKEDDKRSLEPSINFFSLALDGKSLVVVGGTRIERWDMMKRKRTGQWKTDKIFRHDAAATDGRHLALAPDGRHLALANLDGTVYILRLAPGPK